MSEPRRPLPHEFCPTCTCDDHDIKAEAVAAFIRDELSGLLTEALPLIDLREPEPRHYSAIVIAAKIAEFRKP